MNRNREPDKMQRVLVIIIAVMTVAYMYKCWQVDQLIRMI